MSTKVFHEEDSAERIFHFLQTHQNKILIAVSSIVLLIVGWYGYNEYVKKNQMRKKQRMRSTNHSNILLLILLALC